MKHLLEFNSFTLSIIIDPTTSKILTESNDTRDREYTDLAETAYERVFELLKEKQYSKSGDAFIVSGYKIAYEYAGLLIALVHPTHHLVSSTVLDGESKISYALGHTKDGKYKVMVCSSLLNPGDDTHIATRLSKPSFIHEMIHYLDEQRYKGDVKPSAQSANSADYYNHPSEFNAHYQESAYAIRNMLRSPVITTRYMGSFEKFREFATMMMNKQFIKSLNSKNRLKLTKRLYSMYKGMTDELSRQEQ